MKRSITIRLVLMFALAALVTFSLIGAALYGVLVRELIRHQNDDLNLNLQNLRYSIEHVGIAERWTRVQAKMDTLTPSDGRLRFWVLSDDPRFQYGKGLDRIEGMSQEADGHGTILLPPNGQMLRTLSLRIEPYEDRPAVRLIVGVDVAPLEHTLHAFLTALVLLLLSAVLVVMLLGYWIAHLGLQPLKQLSKEAQGLRPQTLSQRLHTENLPVELSDLAVAFNGALGRLQAAYQQLEAFNADVAHELRTPLANLIGGTQVALSRQRTAPQFQEVLQSNLEELDRLRSIINDMLFLARADQGEAATGLTEACVAREVNKTIEFFEFVLDDKGITVAVQGELSAQAAINIPLFRRALSNLLQNAIEHSAAGACLVVEIRNQAEAVWIRVSNPGVRIAATHLPRLFDRFYRVDASRHDEGLHHGHGLGLAIVKAVASMHGGSVAAISVDGVTTIAFSVPSLEAAFEAVAHST
ncbi:MAG: two-component sensor histidine kinase [Rhodocyclales bacterium]|nr:two-component sensor histidine kinase [Rhodocyclales bacterium]